MKKRFHLYYAVRVLIIVWVAFVAWVAWGFMTIRSLERPRYTVSEQHGSYEVRQYAPYLVAQIPMKGSFSRALEESTKVVSDYLAGANTTQASVSHSEYIAKTVPVVQEAQDGSFMVSFVLPSRYTLDTIPRPNNPEIRLVQVASTTAAVLSFTGAADQDTVSKNEQRLRSLLESDKRVILSTARLARYSPSWTPLFLRQNEMIFTVRTYGTPPPY